MLPFCGYHMRLFRALAVDGERTDPAKLPRVYYVNWFRKRPGRRWLWPGYGQNITRAQVDF
jgi:phosphoenolpyruvate carboxykinase (GTP)